MLSEPDSTVTVPQCLSHIVLVLLDLVRSWCQTAHEVIYKMGKTWQVLRQCTIRLRIPDILEKICST